MEREVKFPNDSGIAPHRRLGFSLVELIAILAIVGILAALTIPSIGPLIRSLTLSHASNILAQTFDQAQQMAQSRSQGIELRFYVRTSGQLDVYAVQSFWVDPQTGSVLQAADKRVLLPQGITCVNVPNTESASLLTPLPELVDSQNNYYREFRFRPDGSTNLPSTGTYVVTIATRTDLLHTASTALPSNFTSLQIDPVNGRTRRFQP